MNKFWILGSLQPDDEYKIPVVGEYTEVFDSLEEAQKEASKQEKYLEEYDGEIAVFEVTKVYAHRYPKTAVKTWQEIK